MVKFKKIKLTQGKYALVDVEDFAFLNQWKWFFQRNPKDKTGYAMRNGPPDASGKRGMLRMHRVLISDVASVDHVNGNGLDNRRKNLRAATLYQQATNKGACSHKKTAGCKGVSIVRDRNKVPTYWIARITVQKKRIYLGTFPTHRHATRAYIAAAKQHHGEFAKW